MYPKKPLKFKKFQKWDKNQSQSKTVKPAETLEI